MEFILDFGGRFCSAGQNFSPQWIDSSRASVQSWRRFIGVRRVFDLLSWSPIPLMYCFWIIVLWGAWLKIRSWRKNGFPSSSLPLGQHLLWGHCCFLFFLLWGFNYSRVPIEKQLGLDLKPLKAAEIEAAFQKEATRLIDLRSHLTNARRRPLQRSDFPEVGTNRKGRPGNLARYPWFFYSGSGERATVVSSGGVFALQYSGFVFPLHGWRAHWSRPTSFTMAQVLN